MQPILPSTSVYISYQIVKASFYDKVKERITTYFKNDYALTNNAELVNFLDAAELYLSLQISDLCNSF